MNHLLTAAALLTGVCTACQLYIRLKEDVFLSTNSDNFPIISNKKLEWKITKLYNKNINLSVTFQDTRSNKYLAVNTGNEIKLIDGARNNIWRRTFELQKLGNITFKVTTWISSATDGLNEVMFSGNKFILSNLPSLFYAEVISGCEKIFPGVLATSTTPKTTSIPPKIISSLEQLTKFVVENRKSSDKNKILMDNILNIEMQGLSAANNLSIGGYVLETSSIADMITSKQKLPFKFGVFNQSNSKNEIEVTGESEEFMAIFAAKYKAIHKMFSDDIEIEDNGMARAERYVVNSVLLSAAIANQSVVDKVTIKLQHLNQSVATDSVCAFWNQSGRELINKQKT